MPATIHYLNRDRDHERGQLAAQRVRDAGGSAMDAARAAIQAGTRPIDHPSRLVRQVRSMMKHGAGHPGVQTRFERMAENATAADREHTLSTARLFVELEYRKEREACRASLRTWGKNNRSRLPLSLLREARLILRWLQRYAPGAYPAIVATILNPEFAQAAE